MMGNFGRRETMGPQVTKADRLAPSRMEVTGFEYILKPASESREDQPPLLLSSTFWLWLSGIVTALIVLLPLVVMVLFMLSGIKAGDALFAPLLLIGFVVMFAGWWGWLFLLLPPLTFIFLLGARIISRRVGGSRRGALIGAAGMAAVLVAGYFAISPEVDKLLSSSW